MRLAALSGALWRVRQELERLQFKLDEVPILLAADRPWWLVIVADETGRTLDEIVKLEQRCTEQLEEINDELETPGDRPATLCSVAALVSPEWGDVLTEHQRALTGLRAGVRATALAAEANLSTFDLERMYASGEDALTEEVLLVAMDGLAAMAVFAGDPSATTLLH
jgi:hypothetical protein